MEAEKEKVTLGDSASAVDQGVTVEDLETEETCSKVHGFYIREDNAINVPNKNMSV